MRAAPALAWSRLSLCTWRARPARRVVPLLVLALAFAFASCRGGCRHTPAPARPLGGRLALFPVETHTVVALDVAKVRAAPLATKLAALALARPADEQRLETFRQRTGLDLVHQIDSLIVAFPQEARARGELGIVVRAARFDQARLIAYVRDALQEDGDDLTPTPRGHRTLWAGRKDPTLAGFFLDDRTLVIGGGGWATKMADLAEGAPASSSAESDLELVELCEKAAAGHAIWAAAIVPADLRRQLERDPRFAGAAAVMRMALAIDLGSAAAAPAPAATAAAPSAAAPGARPAPVPGLDAVFTAELADAKEAAALVGKVTDTLRGAKRDPRVLMLGLGPELDGITSKAEGTTFTLRIALGEEQVADLLQRAAMFLTLARQGRAPGFGP
jgi:hypothetical protein